MRTIQIVAILVCSQLAVAGVDQFPADVPAAVFAVRHLKAALQETGHSALTIRLTLDTGLEAQAYRIARVGDAVTVAGGDARGLLYGGLELAERMRLGTLDALTSLEAKPYLARRGLKMNIPLDARTPSFDDSGDAAQHNIAEMWSEDFWTAFLDRMALYRYNTLTLWNPHPFPSMIKLADYPDVALDDVCVTTLEPTGRENEWGEPQCVASNVVANLRCVRRMSIDEKIAFWRRIMQVAADRGIDIYWFNWNICPNSVARPVAPFFKTYAVEVRDEAPGKYGVTHQINNPRTVAYYRAAVKEFLLTYPLIKGIGVTAGENMPKDWQYNREKWLWDTYGLGILDAKAVQPERRIHLVHRVWFSDLGQIMTYWKDYPDPFELSFKYAKARLYSSPTLPFADKQMEAMEPYGLTCWWNLRNDDIFVHRWGDPDYVRAFLRHFNRERTAGYHMGSDGYVWGREFVSKDPLTPRELELDKHWYRFMMWGRLGYDPSLDRAFFERTLQARYPGVDAKALYRTWQTASRIIPLVNRFHWRDWDHMWAVEACLAHVGGFREVFDFCENPTMAGSGMLNPQQFVDAQRAGRAIRETTPPQVADRLDGLAHETLAGMDILADSGHPRGLRLTLSDAQGMAWLGRYYAAKIRAAVAIVRYRQSQDEAFKAAAVGHMESALQHWTRYARLSESNYRAQHLARTKRLDWTLLRGEVERELQMVRDM